MLACSHADLEAEGHFQFMYSFYSISCPPFTWGREFYSMEMPYGPDSCVWMSLLGVCTVHKNVERWENRLQKWLLELNPTNAVGTVLPLTMRAAAGKWDLSAIFFHQERKTGVKQKLRWTWIEVNSEVNWLVVTECHVLESGWWMAFTTPLIKAPSPVAFNAITVQFTWTFGFNCFASRSSLGSQQPPSMQDTNFLLSQLMQDENYWNLYQIEGSWHIRCGNERIQRGQTELQNTMTKVCEDIVEIK